MLSDIHTPIALLDGQSPAEFMRRHWQRRPLLIRQALPRMKPPIGFAALRRLAREDDVESRLVWQEDGRWAMEHGPFARLPKAGEPGWTLLVQGMDLHDEATAALMQRFRFVPDARLDDAMISIASDGGGVGPHVDSYDVFLLQAAGRRRWRIGRQKDLSLDPDAPLRILQHFEPTEEYVLEPGDMLYLPPQVAHEGVALGDGCMTISIGFRALNRAELARGMLETAADGLAEAPRVGDARLYRDPGQPASLAPAALPEPLVEAALDALRTVRLDRALAVRFLGRHLSEPKPGVFFAPGTELPDLIGAWPADGRLVLDRRTRMLYDGSHVFINGEDEPLRSAGALRMLADARELACAQARPAMAERERLQAWLEAGWVHYRDAAGK
ncbi:cupin domain-containing protein [Verticiella sediminum]|uniref:Cupin domain-containing protein n=1 Tax=Verticiella sediminum TaxID=1247510 RepID=A0A556A7G0_9BURK|nr:cupin domain-containing protein [Verticiella sediminum]TSH88810.1 cupin domain-containing protein [Verticiella sediminum]